MGEDELSGLRTRCFAVVEQIASEWETFRPVAEQDESSLLGGLPASSSAGRVDDDEDPLAAPIQSLASDLQRQCRDGPLIAAAAAAAASAETRQAANEDGLGDQLLAQIPQRLDYLLAASYSRFYCYLSRGPPYWLRQLYTDTSILKFSLLFLTQQTTDSLLRRGTLPSYDVKSSDELGKLVEPLDLALILAGGAGVSRGGRWINDTFALLEGALAAADGGQGVSSHGATGKSLGTWSTSVPFSRHEPFTPPVKNPIKRTGPLSIESFQRYLDRPADRKLGPEPVVISSLQDDWPARTVHPWDRPDYLLSRTFGGRRLVPIEIGRSYVDGDWTQKLVTFGEYVRAHVDPSPDEHERVAKLIRVPGSTTPSTTAATRQSTTTATAYLAQHPLFTQLPALRADILTPDLCYTAPPPHPTDRSQDRPELDEPRLNAWFGPPGTITPLHTDPYHNLLAQVVGRKYVRLYGPQQSPLMRSRGKEGDVDMANTSLWDVGVEEGWDDAADEGGGGSDSGSGSGQTQTPGKGPGGRDAFRRIPFVDCILQPGDTLYIPIGWWHYVRGLSVSFSVSFWWN